MTDNQALPGPLRIAIVLDITPEAIVAVDAEIMHHKNDQGPATKARMELLTPIVNEHMLALAKAVGDAASGSEMVVVAHTQAGPSFWGRYVTRRA